MRLHRRTLLATAPLGLVGCGDASSAVDGFTGGDGSFTLIPAAQRSAAPPLAGTTIDGRQLALTDYPDKIIVLNVWGSWCAPCRHEAPALVEAATTLGDRAQFVGINTRDLDVAPAQAFVRTFKIPYPNLFDPDGTLLLGFGQLPPKAIPSTLIIDSARRVAARILGEVTAATVVGAVHDIAEQP